MVRGAEVEDGFRRGDRCYDLGVGSLEVKRPWQTSVARPVTGSHTFPATVSRVQLLRLKRWLTGRLGGAAPHGGRVRCRVSIASRRRELRNSRFGRQSRQIA